MESFILDTVYYTKFFRIQLLRDLQGRPDEIEKMNEMRDMN